MTLMHTPLAQHKQRATVDIIGGAMALLLHALEMWQQLISFAVVVDALA